MSEGRAMAEKNRCWGEPQIFTDYHDFEWGRPARDDGRLFEMLSLECMQAGLSWLTILKKRDAFRRAFDGFDIETVAGYGDARIEELMGDAGIVRNRLKIHAIIANARAIRKIQDECGSFADYLWGFVGGTPVIGGGEWPPTTPLSDTISADLKRRGFKFVGSTIVYAFLQAVGIVNDHKRDCFVFRELQGGE